MRTLQWSMKVLEFLSAIFFFFTGPFFFFATLWQLTHTQMADQSGFDPCECICGHFNMMARLLQQVGEMCVCVFVCVSASLFLLRVKRTPEEKPRSFFSPILALTNKKTHTDNQSISHSHLHSDQLICSQTLTHTAPQFTKHLH